MKSCFGFCTISERFDNTEPSPTVPPPGEQGSCALSRGGSTALNHLEPPRTSPLQSPSSGRFNHTHTDTRKFSVLVRVFLTASNDPISNNFTTETKRQGLARVHGNKVCRVVVC